MKTLNSLILVSSFFISIPAVLAMSSLNADFLVKKCPKKVNVVDTLHCQILGKKNAILNFTESDAELSADQIQNARVSEAKIAGFTINLASWLRTNDISKGHSVPLASPQRMIALQVVDKFHHEVRSKEFLITGENVSPTILIEDKADAQLFAEVIASFKGSRP